jgi:hypothetical protein
LKSLYDEKSTLVTSPKWRVFLFSYSFFKIKLKKNNIIYFIILLIKKIEKKSHEIYIYILLILETQIIFLSQNTHVRFINKKL